MIHSNMILLLQLIAIVVALVSHQHVAIADYLPWPPYSSAVAQVYKHADAAKPLYSLKIMTYVNKHHEHANLLIDLDAPLTWHECVVDWNTYEVDCPANTLCTLPVSCEENQCTDVRTTYSYHNPSCPPVNNGSTLPGWGHCTCPVNVVNPVTGSCTQAMLNHDDLALNTSNGRNAFIGQYGTYPNAACAPSSSFKSFPRNVRGVMALSSSPYAITAQTIGPFKRVMALCLPSTLSSPGVFFLGGTSYYLLPQSNVDIMSFLSYTPLIKQPNSFGYFISVNSIVIKKRSIDIPGNTKTKLSTTDPYTTLRTDIYKRVVRRFSLVTKRISPAKPVAPFGICFRASVNGLRVPDIEFNLQNGTKWSISTANSVKQVTKDVACLAFVDGGAKSEPAIVMGAFQFEDNFLVFDFEKWRLGFSSSLLRTKTSCANFNFTLTD